MNRTLALCAILAMASTALASPLLAGGAALPATQPDARRSVTYPTRTMGTYANVILVTADSAAGAPTAALAHAVFHRVDSLMSNWTTTSEVARLNREAAAGPTPVHPEVAVVLDASMRLWAESDGAFDITVEPLVRLWGFLGGPKRVPSDAEVAAAFKRVGARQLHFDPTAQTLSYDNDGVKIDLGGIAKGYAVDVAADTLKAHGVTDGLVDLTGNMAAIGSPPGSKRWRIGIRDPRDRMTHFARLLLDGGEAISTSGKYEQFVAANGKTYGHIMDPRTGRPAEGLISVTVVATSAFECDAWDTPLFVLGAEVAKRKAKEREHIAVVLVEPGKDGIDTVWVESALKDRFSLEPAAKSLFRVRTF